MLRAARSSPVQANADVRTEMLDLRAGWPGPEVLQLPLLAACGLLFHAPGPENMVRRRAGPSFRVSVSSFGMACSCLICFFTPVVLTT